MKTTLTGTPPNHIYAPSDFPHGNLGVIVTNMASARYNGFVVQKISNMIILVGEHATYWNNAAGFTDVSKFAIRALQPGEVVTITI